MKLFSLGTRWLGLFIMTSVAIACGSGASSNGAGSSGAGSSGGNGLGGDDSATNGGSGSAGSSGSNKDASAPHDGGGSSSSGGDAQAGDSGTGITSAFVNHLTFTGCSPSWDDVQVVTNVVSYDSLEVVNGTSPLDGGVQIALLLSTPLTVQLSTPERVGPPQNQLVINVYAGGVTYTNDCTSGCNYDPTTHTYLDDPISGTFTANAYDPTLGLLDVAFTNVVLQEVQGTGATCTVNGTLTTNRLTL